MRDYCGINGCYEIDAEDDNEETLCVYLNSPIVYESDDDSNDEGIRATAENRSIPEVEFIINKAVGDEGDKAFVSSMVVGGLGLHGVNEFVSEILNLDISDKSSLILAVKQLLDRDGAVWGIVIPDDEIE